MKGGSTRHHNALSVSQMQYRREIILITSSDSCVLCGMVCDIIGENNINLTGHVTSDEVGKHFTIHTQK